jgi:hypothetical protein
MGESTPGAVGAPIDDIGGSAAGRVEGFFADSSNRVPAWLIARLGRFGKVIAIPFLDTASAGGRVWVAHGRDALHEAPAVDPSRALTREQELALCAHYRIGEDLGRAKEVSGRPPGTVTAKPAGA